MTSPADPEVESLLAALKHPHKDAVLAVRALVRAADPRVQESVKWNAPSFSLPAAGHFATFHLRARSGVTLVMHFDAKKRARLPERSSIADPGKLLKWLADDRAQVSFADAAAVEASREAFLTLVRAWMGAIPSAGEASK